MSLPQLPALKPADFRWHSSPSSPGAVQRLANGTEAWVGIKDENAKGQYDNYLNTTLRIVTLPASLSLSGLKEKLALALVHLRYQHPEVACVAVWPADGGPKPHITYTPPKDTAEALAWARGVVSVRAAGMTGFELRAELVKQRARKAVPEPAPSVALFLVAGVTDETTVLKPGTRVDLLVHFNHIYWDGVSGRMFVGELLRRLGDTVGKDGEEIFSNAHYRWGDEVTNLSEPILDACEVDVESLTDDVQFKEARDEFLAKLMASSSSWGLNVTNSKGTPRTEWFNFTKTQSESMLHAVKTRMGPQYTITHLGHAAMVLALLKTRPLPADDNTAKLITPLPVNGRYFLGDRFDKLYGACQAGAVVEFPNLGSWMVDESGMAAVGRTLEGLVRHIKKSYDYWLAKPFLLALGVSKDNFLFSFLSSTQASSAASSIPIFVSDGVVDRYVPGDVVSDRCEPLMTVEACSFFLDTYLDSLLIRMDSWKGVTSLSFCFNDGYYSPEAAGAFLRDMAGFMLAFAEKGTG